MGILLLYWTLGIQPSRRTRSTTVCCDSDLHFIPLGQNKRDQQLFNISRIFGLRITTGDVSSLQQSMSRQYLYLTCDELNVSYNLRQLCKLNHRVVNDMPNRVTTAMYKDIYIILIMKHNHHPQAYIR